MPRISIIIPTYNRARFVAQAIESVQTQTFADWEMIVVDDASEDDTPGIVAKQVAQDQRIKYFRNEVNLGISRTRNRGLELAQGEYIAVLDSDDIWCDMEKLQKQSDFLEQHPDYSLIGGAVILVDEQGSEIGRRQPPIADQDIRSGLLLKNTLVHSSIMYRREAVKGLGGYDVKLSSGEDYDLWLRLGREHKLANLPDYVVKYRVHSGNISISERLKTLRINLELVKKNKDYYPGYFRALCRRLLRLSAYQIMAAIKESF